MTTFTVTVRDEGRDKLARVLRDYGVPQQEAAGGAALAEVDFVIVAWCIELGIDPDWPKNLHPADVLDKYVFPRVRALLKQAPAKAGTP